MEAGVTPVVTALNVALTGLSIVGNEFIKRRNRRGYWLWLIGNAMGLTMFMLLGQWITAALYGDFTASCVQGVAHWGGWNNKPTIDP